MERPSPRTDALVEISGDEGWNAVDVRHVRQLEWELEDANVRVKALEDELEWRLGDYDAGYNAGRSSSDD